MIRSLVSLSVLLGVVALGVYGVREASAEPQRGWDQERVTALANEFKGKVEAVEDAVRKEPAVSAQATEYWRMRESVRRVRNEAKHLSKQLLGGKGHDETLGVFENLLQQIQAARESADRLHLTQTVIDKLQAARAVLQEIQPYYDAPPLPPRRA